jgi:putative transposase
VLAQIHDALVYRARAQAGKAAPKHLTVDSQRVPSTVKGGARGYDGGKKIKGRKRHLVVDSQGSVLGVWGSPADVSDARGARVVLAQVLRRYPSAQIVIADGAYDKEGLLYQSQGQSLQLPPSLRFPPLREGNQAARFPLHAGGT